MTKVPSSRELQLLAVLAPSTGGTAEGVELSGRQIAKMREKATGETISYGIMYTTLAGLEETGWVRSRDDVHKGRPTRWYRLSQSGLDAVRQGLNSAESNDASAAEPRQTGT